MIKRIFLKSLILLILVCLFKTHSTNAYFTNAAVSSENTFTVGDWTAPNSHVVNPLDDSENPGILSDYENNSIFNVYYIAEDSLSGIGQVQFYYSYNYENWQLFGIDTDIDGEFQFTSPDGDGVYEFKTVAFDNVGNEEDEDENDVGDSQDLTTFPVFLYVDASTIVDTTPPVTMFSVNPYLAVTNELLYNGGFESGNLDGWTVVESDGDHKVVGNDYKTGTQSALLGSRDTLDETINYDSIKQTISLPPVITSTLSFWYRLMTSDNVSGGFFDVFVIPTAPTGTDPVMVAHDGWDDPEILETDFGWKNVTYQLNGLEGENINIQFKVTQPYEYYRTWAYLDDVKVCVATNSATTTTDFSLSSHDGSGSDNSTINYSLDGVNQGGTAPFTLSTGNHTLVYSATDEAGNIESEKQINIAIQEDIVDFGVVLNEILPNPSGEDNVSKPNGEWVKLYNNSATDVNAVGWKLEDTSGGSLIIDTSNSDNNGNPSDDGETIVPVGGILTVYRNGDSDFVINDDIETIKLYNVSVLIDSYSYNFAVGLFEGKTLKRDPDGTGGWKDPEAETIPETSPISTPAAELLPTLLPSPEVSPTPTSELSSVPNPTPTPAAELPAADELQEESQPEKPIQEEIPAETVNKTDE